MTPATEAGLDATKTALANENSFRADSMLFQASEDKAANGAVAVVVKVQTRFGFMVAYRAGEDELQKTPAAVASQLNDLALEEVARRYMAIKAKVRDLARDAE